MTATAPRSPLRGIASFVRRRGTALAVLTLVLGSLALVTAHVRYHPSLSPVDELQHIDYLYRAPEMVPDGSKVQQEAMREQACRALTGYPSPPCSLTARYDPEDFQESGTNTAAIYTPFYYTVTKVVAYPLTVLPGLDSLVTAGRLVGGLWLAAGLVLTFVLARRLGAPRAPTVALLLGTAATPNVLLPAATITPDAAGLLAGAAMVWSVLWWEERPARRLWLPALVSLAVVSLKAINILVVLLVALYIALRWAHARFWPSAPSVERDLAGAVTDPPPSWGWSLAGVSAVSFVGLVGALGYVALSRATSVASSEGVSMAQTAATDSFPLDGFVSHLLTFLDVLYEPGWWVTVAPIGPLVQGVAGLVVFAGTFAAAFLLDRVRRRGRLLAGALLVVGVVGAPLIIAITYLSTGGYVPIPGRYALTLVPAGVALASAALERRSVRGVLVVAGSLGYLLTLAAMLF